MEVVDDPPASVLPSQLDQNASHNRSHRPRNHHARVNRNNTSGPADQTSNPPQGRRPPRVGDGGRKQKNRSPGNGNPSRGSTTARASRLQELKLGPEPNAGNGGGPSAPPRTRNPKRQDQPKVPDPARSTDISTATSSVTSGSTERSHPGSNAASGPRRTGRRGANFNAGLTEPSSIQGSVNQPSSSTKTTEKYKIPKPHDLTSTLIHGLSSPPYPDCPICVSAINPFQPTWSCSPNIPISASANDENQRDNENAPCCWTTFHVKCIRSWAVKSVKEVADAWQARGEERRGEWRCPACQTKREIVPSGYWCFCGSTPEPKPTRLATPHSCANACSRRRVCGHPCPLPCHPGPCPPCQVATQLPCYCGGQTLAFRCSHLAPGREGSAGADLSCGNVCGKLLGCGNHRCEQVCHPGSCEPCDVRAMAKCYCGKVFRELGCGEGEEKMCAVDETEDGIEEKWIGRFDCESACERLFDCSIHHCSKSCHPPSRSPPPCPRSPSLVTHCPCGKHSLSPSSASAFSSQNFYSRTTCLDPIPTCTSTCMKPLTACNHVCSTKCHFGSCPPCSIMLVRPCRCGATTRDVRCSNVQAGIHDEILCDKPCAALRACGRHQCNRVCCPLAALAGAVKGKGKKRAVLDEVGMDEGGLHECDLICGRVLSCGNHRCEERDHKGICPPCLRSSFEEMVCYCGRTVLEPPIPCGTRINCTYPCTRPPPPCGHLRTQHSCHEDPAPCPPCPFLTSKACACGKKAVRNVRCSQEKVSCGTPCGKLLACGFHHCERLCHGDDCGACTSPCGKSRKLCLPAHHPCAHPCHAPSACPEVDPCQSIITLTCPCGRIRQAVHCGRSASNPLGRETSLQPKCSNECNIAKRNARLADALGINVEAREKALVSYNDELTAFARTNPKFLGLVEKAFAELITSEKKTQVLPHMPPDRRNFVHNLATVYRMDAQMVDQEPHRSVQLLRRIDTRIPSPLLSSVIASSTASSLGKLADFRGASAPSWRSPAPASAATKTAGTGGTQRGWTSVVGRSANVTPTSTPPPSVTPATNPQTITNPTPTLTPSATPGLHHGGHARLVPTDNASISSMEDKLVPDNWEDDL